MILHGMAIIKQVGLMAFDLLFIVIDQEFKERSHKEDTNSSL